MQKLVAKLSQAHPEIRFVAADTFYWSPKDGTVYYVKKHKEPSHAEWTLLHETAHSLLGHTTYASDLELLQLETDAWQKARSLATSYNMEISENFIEDCLDSYRDWLHARSTCPSCSLKTLQTDPRHYQCHNCKHTWKVSTSRLCRPYRLSVA